MRRIITVLILTGALTGFSFGKEFTVSFGEGGLKKYKVIDNTCFSYIIGYPKTDDYLSNMWRFNQEEVAMRHLLMSVLISGMILGVSSAGDIIEVSDSQLDTVYAQGFNFTLNTDNLRSFNQHK